MKRKFLLLLLIIPILSFSQTIRWSKDGNSYLRIESNEIVQYALPGNTKTVLVSSANLTPVGGTALQVRHFTFSQDQQKALLFVNTVKVWRLNTRGDYWVLDMATKQLYKLGKERPASTLMFAKLSPDGTMAAYVSDQNLYVENLTTGVAKALTTDGNRKHINGTFDWVYEEEFACRDGFQWSPDSKHIAFWQIDAAGIKDYYMINTTDSVHSRIVPVEYPTIGESPSAARIGVIDIQSAKTVWMNIPGDPRQNYLPRVEWSSASEILIQQLDRKQQVSKIFSCNPVSGASKLLHTEKDEAWIELFSFTSSNQVDFRHQLLWLNGGKDFLWHSEKDGWGHLYKVSRETGKETLLTVGNMDVVDYVSVDEKKNTLYFLASPDNATQSYLYKTTLDGKGKPARVTPAGLNGTHSYQISPNGKFAFHSFTNANTRTIDEWIEIPSLKPLSAESIDKKIAGATGTKKVEFFKVKTSEGVEMDGWMVKPAGFDEKKKYPVVFYVYTEPAGQTVRDTYSTGGNSLYVGDMAADGYIYMSLDGRGTPAPKGRAWRKSIYRKIGQVNIRDQALGAQEILKWGFIDADRVAVWGWSGGGSTTLNLLFQYPDIYKTGISVAAVANQLTYDNIYQERYMGLPQENMQDIVNGSPVTYAKNLKGNLLYIHGTGDDNVHYNNAEMLINELIKYNKQFQFMAYPNRTHGISEGEGTREHLRTLYTSYLKQYCPPGGR